MVRILDGGGPDQDFSCADVREGAGIGSGHGPDKIADFPGRLFPVNFTVFRPATGEHGCLCVVLGNTRSFFLEDQRQGFVQQGSGRGHGLAVQIQGRVLFFYGKGLLGHDVTCIGLLDHMVQGDSGLGFALDQHPVQGAAASVGRQKRAVQIQASFGEN